MCTCSQDRHTGSPSSGVPFFTYRLPMGQLFLTGIAGVVVCVCLLASISVGEPATAETPNGVDSVQEKYPQSSPPTELITSKCFWSGNQRSRDGESNPK